MDKAVEAFILAVSKKYDSGLSAALTRDARFRGLTPNDEWDARSPDEIVKILFGSWFDPHDEITNLISYDVHNLADRVGFIYRMRGTNPGGDFIVEQQGYATLAEDGRIADISIVCSGFRAEAVAD